MHIVTNDSFSFFFCTMPACALKEALIIFDCINSGNESSRCGGCERALHIHIIFCFLFYFHSEAKKKLQNYKRSKSHDALYSQPDLIYCFNRYWLIGRKSSINFFFEPRTSRNNEQNSKLK